jgi:hypothetical protein
MPYASPSGTIDVYYGARIANFKRPGVYTRADDVQASATVRQTMLEHNITN